MIASSERPLISTILATTRLNAGPKRAETTVASSVENAGSTTPWEKRRMSSFTLSTLIACWPRTLVVETASVIAALAAVAESARIFTEAPGTGTSATSSSARSPGPCSQASLVERAIGTPPFTRPLAGDRIGDGLTLAGALCYEVPRVSPAVPAFCQVVGIVSAAPAAPEIGE